MIERTNTKPEDIVIAIDVSGEGATKASLKEFHQFLDDIINMLKSIPLRGHLVFFDLDFQNWYSFDEWKNKDIEIKRSGFGRMDYTVLFEAIKERGLKPLKVVCITDGYGVFPKEEPPYSVLWLLTTDNKVPFGDKLFLSI